MQSSFLLANCHLFVSTAPQMAIRLLEKQACDTIFIYFTVSLLENLADDRIHVADIDVAIVIHVSCGNA